jgi:hypothetical protein
LCFGPFHVNPNRDGLLGFKHGDIAVSLPQAYRNRPAILTEYMQCTALGNEEVHNSLIAEK